MTDEELIARAQEALEVESREELEHVLTCSDCYLFDQCDYGPFYCLEFRKTFRGYVPAERPAGGFIPAVWSNAILEALNMRSRI